MVVVRGEAPRLVDHGGDAAVDVVGQAVEGDGRGRGHAQGGGSDRRHAPDKVVHPLLLGRHGRQLAPLLLLVLPLVGIHLGHPHHRVLALREGAVEVRALQLIFAVGNFTVGAGAELAEAGGADHVLLAVVLAVGRHLGAVGAAEATAQAVEVGAVARELAVGEVAAERGLEALEVVQHQVVHAVVVLRVLVHVGAAAELVAAVLARAVVVGHLQGKLAARVLAVLVQVVAPEALQHHPLVQHLPRRRGLAAFAERRHVLNDPEALLGAGGRGNGDGVACRERSECIKE